MFTQNKAEIIYKNLREVDVEMRCSRENAISEERTNGGLPRGTRP